MIEQTKKLFQHDRMKKIINLEKFIKNKTLREWIEALVFALIVATIFRTWLYAPFRVPTGSMIPTIMEGDHFFANMHYYGFVIPFTDNKLFSSEPKKGDVIIFPRPNNPKKCQEFLFGLTDTIKSLFFSFLNPNYVPVCMDYIKRVVAVGGDKLLIDGENVYVNGKREKGYTPYFNLYYPPYLKYENITIPEGKIFAMGDNRRNSQDSRDWGFVELKNVRAKASMIYLSFEPNKNMFSGFRGERIGQTF